MTAGPKVTTSKTGNSRYYHHPETGEKAIGVTSVIDNLPKDFLKWWAAKVVAETAVEDFPTLMTMIMSDSPDSKSAAVDWLKRAHLRVTGDAATKGNRVHEWTEKIDEAGSMPRRVPKDLLPFMRGYLEFRQQTECEIQHVETTVWDSTHNYMGTFDRTLILPESAFEHFDTPPPWYEGGSLPIMGDVKTTRSGIHSEVGLQIAAYRLASHYMEADEHGQFTSKPMFPTSSTGLVIHLRPEAWRLVPVAAGQQELDTFVHLLGIHKYEKSLKSKIILPDIAGAEIQETAVVALDKLLREMQD